MDFEYETDDFSAWLPRGFKAKKGTSANLRVVVPRNKKPQNPSQCPIVPDPCSQSHGSHSSHSPSPIAPSAQISNPATKGHVTWILSTKPMIFRVGFREVFKAKKGTSANLRVVVPRNKKPQNPSQRPIVPDPSPSPMGHIRLICLISHSPSPIAPSTQIPNPRHQRACHMDFEYERDEFSG